MPSYFITGANRGIGLAIVEELVKDEKNFVVATVRNPGAAKDLNALSAKVTKKRLAVIQLDVADTKSIEHAVAEATPLLPHGIDYLINNAGVNFQPSAPFENMDYELFAKEMRFNTVVPVQIGNAFLPLVKKSSAKKIVFITSQLGSLEIGAQLPGLANAYSVSKAALNMLARKWGATLKPQGITTILIHPGWVQTEIGDTLDEWVNTYAPGLASTKITTKESAEGTVKVIHEAKLEDATSFYNVDGTAKPW
ncbi:hypothetical protein BD779DRAFT_1228150 [Infundibulicybe gibba]|nr:hypothetical protein BD779DRAFT_1228150 [Infundibulicybe gibba]